MKLNRVFALVPDCHVTGWRYAAVWRRHFYAGLAGAGLKLRLPENVDFSWVRPPQALDPALLSGPRTRTSEVLLDQILSSEGDRPQAVISCCFSHDLEPGLVDQVRAAGVPWINFFCDSLYAFDRVSELAAHTSLNWFVESAAEASYAALGVPWLRAPYALNPEELSEAGCLDPRRELLFVGTANRYRLRAAAWLRLYGADLHVRGWGWPEALSASPPGTPALHPSRLARGCLRRMLRGRVSGHLDEDALRQELHTSAVVLGLNEAGTTATPCRYLKLRDVELPGRGCCYLAQAHADLAELFVPGKEIHLFETPREAARLSRALARHPAECRAVGRRARERVLHEHTWPIRLQQMAARL